MNLFADLEEKTFQSAGDFSAVCKSAQPGDVIAFGSYPQGEQGETAPIRWRVLENTGEELFLLSEYLLDCKRYHGKTADITWYDCVDITWRDCDLRAWLNGEFFDTAFSKEEQKLIKTAHCTDNGVNAPDTEDRVFLLSVEEITAATETLGREFRRTVGTEFAMVKKADGCKLLPYSKSNKDNYITVNGEEVGCCWWWLRTQGNKPTRAYFVGTSFSIRSYGNNSISGYGVRPALKLRY